jgi:hypothetical protein
LITLLETTAVILAFSCVDLTKPLEEEEMGIFMKGKENSTVIIRRRAP